MQALDTWLGGSGDDDDIDAMICGPLQLETLDCLQQQELEALTKRLINFHLQLPWMRSEATIGQARLICHGEQFATSGEDAEQLVAAIDAAGPKLSDYWCFLLLDLAMADRELDEMGLLAGLLTAEDLGIRETFEGIANKEIKVTKRRLGELWQDREHLREQASKAAAQAEKEAQE